MSTQKSKLASNDSDSQPGSGQRPAVRFRSEPSPETSEPEDGFSGTWQNMSLPDLIQLVQMGRRDALVGIKRRDGRRALLWCREGDIIDAWCEGELGEQAVYRALGWEGGEVSVAFQAVERPRRIHMATSALLLHAAYQKDSVVRELKPRPREASNPRLTDVPPPAEPLLDAAPESPPLRERRLPTRVELAALAAVLLLFGLSATWLSSRQRASTAQPPRQAVLARIEPARPQPIPNENPAASVVVERVPAAAPEPARRPPPRTRAPATPARTLAAAPPSAAPKASAKAKSPEPRAPRIQIIEERPSKIEVLE
ncbi:MAG: DUF4388 domain-containing protein [Polyangiaceae bacterium]